MGVGTRGIPLEFLFAAILADLSEFGRRAKARAVTLWLWGFKTNLRA